MEHLNLLETFNVLRDCYKNIDFRAAYYKNGDDWEYIISYIRFTRKSVEEIKKIQESLKPYDIQSKNFRIDYQIVPADEFEDKWEEIKKSTERTFNPLSEDEIKSVINLIYRGKTSNYLLEQDKRDFNSIFFTVEFTKNREHHERFNSLNEEIRRSGETGIYPVIKRALQIDNFTLNSPLYCAILFPIYVQINLESIRLVNNYLTLEIVFHNFFENYEFFFQIDNNVDNRSEKVKFILSTDREKIRYFKFESINDGFNKIQFTTYFGDIRISDANKKHMNLTIRFLYSAIGDFLIDFKTPINQIYYDIIGKDKIPDSILSILVPFLEINLLDKENKKGRFEEIKENILQNQFKSTITVIKENIEWLHDPGSRRILREFFINAANRPDSEYNNFFLEFIIDCCSRAINEDLFDDTNILSKINDLLIDFNILGFQQNLKLNYYKNSLARLREDIRYLFEELFENYPLCNEISKYERGLRFNLDYPILWSECRGHYHEKIQFRFYFIRNDYSKLNYHNFYLFFWIVKNDWNIVSSHEVEKIIEFIKRLSQIPKLSIVEKKYLPGLILSKLKDFSISVPYSIQSEVYPQRDQFRIINSKGTSREKEYFDLNILIGKNNSGKTMALTMLFHNINSPNRIFDRMDKVEEFKKQYPNYPEYEMFYIPHRRILPESIGKSTNLQKALIDFFIAITNLRSQKYVKIESYLIENRSKENSNEYWIIPNFIEIIDIFSFNLKEEQSLNEIDQLIVQYGGNLIETFNKAFKNWCIIVNEFFPDVQIESLKSLDREGNQCVSISDLYTGREITNWKSLGSGTQQLLNLIFLIEYFKIGPIDDTKFLESIKMGKIEEAFNDHIAFTYINRILFIDEPEVSLHPGLQRNFFEYLTESSQRLQIFIATHSPFFLDIPRFTDLIGNKIGVNLHIKTNKGTFESLPINKYNKLRIVDEIFEFNPIETAFYLSKDNYADLLYTHQKRGFNLLQLNMINNMIKKRFSPDYLALLKLGTAYEDINQRLIQNAHFLIFEPSLIDLTENFGKQEDWTQIIIYQINISRYESKVKRKRFEGVCLSCWDKKKVKELVLTYSETQAKELGQRILTSLKKHKIIENQSILVLPENSIPYSLLNELIEFAINNRIIIIGGMEHRKLSEIENMLIEISNSYPKKYVQASNLYDIQSDPSINENVYINQAIIINSNGCFSFQVKNIPVYINHYKQRENIPIILNPTYIKFNTSIGKIAIFICKDFLVNYSVIDKWMEKNEISLIAVPSFTELVNPFRNKFGEIVHQSENREKTFIFTNIAEFGGSGIYNFDQRRNYEPGERSVFNPREEKCESFLRDVFS